MSAEALIAVNMNHRHLVLTGLPSHDGSEGRCHNRCLCRTAAASILQTHGAALRRAAVAQWEVRLRVADRSGAWRIIVSIPTGAS